MKTRHFLSVCAAIVLAVSTCGGAEIGMPPREGLQLWLDASAPDAFEARNNQVALWRDRSGTGHHATAVGQPKLVEASFNGKTCVRMAGKDYFKVGRISTKTGPVTAFIVSRRDERQAGTGTWQRLISIRQGETADNKPPNLCLTIQKPSAYTNSVSVITKDSIAPGEVAIGAVAGSGSSGFRGDIAEVLIYDRGFLSEGALREVLDYLGRKWAAEVDRKDKGWTLLGALKDMPKRVSDKLPLSDQGNREGWTAFEPFTDEFNGSDLDTNKWVSPYRWKGRPPALFRRSNVTVTNGSMVLAMRREEVPETKKDPKYHTYTSSYVSTRLLSSYGYYEVRAKAMNSAGSSSFWFAGGAKTWRIEIDVFEIGGKAVGRERAYNMNAHVFREAGKDDHWSTGSVWEAPWDLAADFHVYGLEWSKEFLRYYVDGVLVRSMPNTHWHHPMHLIFDSETMPDWFGLPKDQDLPSFFDIDYVRAWKKPGWDGAVTEEQLAEK